MNFRSSKRINTVYLKPHALRLENTGILKDKQNTKNKTKNYNAKEEYGKIKEEDESDSFVEENINRKATINVDNNDKPTFNFLDDNEEDLDNNKYINKNYITMNKNNKDNSNNFQIDYNENNYDNFEYINTESSNNYNSNLVKGRPEIHNIKYNISEDIYKNEDLLIKKYNQDSKSYNNLRPDLCISNKSEISDKTLKSIPQKNESVLNNLNCINNKQHLHTDIRYSNSIKKDKFSIDKILTASDIDNLNAYMEHTNFMENFNSINKEKVSEEKRYLNSNLNTLKTSETSSVNTRSLKNQEDLILKANNIKKSKDNTLKNNKNNASNNKLNNKTSSYVFKDYQLSDKELMSLDELSLEAQIRLKSLLPSKKNTNNIVNIKENNIQSTKKNYNISECKGLKSNKSAVVFKKNLYKKNNDDCIENNNKYISSNNMKDINNSDQNKNIIEKENSNKESIKNKLSKANLAKSKSRKSIEFSIIVDKRNSDSQYSKKV